jgi:hypothetical protein
VEHDFCHSIFFSGSEMAPIIPATPVPLTLSNSIEALKTEGNGEASPRDYDYSKMCQKFPFLQAFEFGVTTSHANLTSEMTGYFFLDYYSQSVYEYTLDRSAILNIFNVEKTQAHLHIQILHLVIVHLQDPELADQIMVHMSSKRPKNVTSDLMKEFLLATPYQALKDLGMEKHLLRALPVTSLTGAESKEVRRRTMHSYNISIMPGSWQLPGTKLELPPRNFKLFSSDDRRDSNVPSVRTIFERFFGLEDSML